MKKLSIITFFLFLFFYSYSQNNNLPVLQKEIIAGKDFSTNKEIKGTEYIFPERIYHSYIDSSSTLLSVQLRGLSKNGKRLNNKGFLIVYDLQKKASNWSKKVNYLKSSFKQFSHFVIQEDIKKSYAFDLTTGEKKWETKNKIYYIDPNYKVGVGYDYMNPSLGFSNKLKGLDLITGAEIWQREVNKEYGWNDVLHMNDSTIIIVAGGLHAININNGSGWDYNTITGEKDYKATIAKNVLGTALGVATGTFIFSTGYNLVRNVVSNVIIDSANIYFASREKIACLYKNGNLKWSNPLSKELMSESTIFIKDSLLYLINNGYAFMNYRQLDYGKPFIAAFSLMTGKQQFLYLIKNNKQINSYAYKKDAICIMFNDRISKYSLLNGEKFYEKVFNKDTVGELSYFIGQTVYMKDNDSLYTSLFLSDSTKFFSYTKTGKILKLNNNLSIEKTIDVNNIFNQHYNINEYKILTNNNKTIVIDKIGKKIADINISRYAVKKGATLYDVKRKSFFIVDVKNIVDK